MKRVASRALGRLATALLGALALVGLGLSAAFLLVSTDAGRAILIPRLVRAADDALAGRIELDSFHLLAEGGISLEGLRVFDPDGDPVLSVERALVTVDVVRPRTRTVALRLQIDRPTLFLVRGVDGSLSLARAFAPSRVSQGQPSRPAGDSAWTVRIGHLALRGGGIRYTTAAGATALEADGISIEGRGEYGRDGSQVELRLRGRLTRPSEQAAALDLAGSLRHGALRLSLLKASLGSSAVEAVAVGDLPGRAGRAAVLAAELSGSEARRLLPEEPITGELAGVAYGESDGREATGAIEARAGVSRAGGSARAAAAMRLGPGRFAAGFDVALDGLDPSQVLSIAPSGSITLAARGRAAGESVADLRGRLELELAPSRLRGGRIGPGELRATAAAGSFEVSRLALSLPGGNVDGSGRYLLRGEAAGQLAAEAQDLGALARNLTALLGRDLPRMAGRAQLSAELTGTAAAPVARLSVSAPSASVGASTVRSLAVSGELRGPRQAVQGRFEGSAAAISIAGRELRRVGLRASVLGRNVDLAFSGLAPDLGDEPVTVQASGELAQDRVKLRISSLALSYPGTQFALAAPAEVVLAGPSVDRLELAAGEQRISVAGGIQGRSLDFSAAAEALALGRPLGRLLPDWQLDGRLSARIHATGRVESEESGDRFRDLLAEGHIELAGAAVRGVTGLSAVVDLRYDGERRRATLGLDARRDAGGELSCRAELPVDPAHAAPESPISAKLVLRSIPLADGLRLAAAGVPSEASGEASVEVTVGGTVGAPSISGAVSLAGAAYGEWGPWATTATVEGGAGEARLGAVVDLRGARLLAADGRLAVELSALLRRPRSALLALSHAPIAATATLPGFDLARIAGMGDVPERIAGSLAGEAVVRGTWEAPRVQAKVDLTGGAYRAYTGLGLHAEARAGDSSVELAATGTLRASEVLRLSGRIGRPLEKLAAGSSLEGAPFDLAVVVPETALERVDPAFPVSGRVAGVLKAGGTLGSPRVDADIRARRLSLTEGAIGDLDAAAHHSGSEGRAHVELRAARGGTLTADLRLVASLGLASLRRGNFGESPADAHLVASRLDLALLPVVAPGLVRLAQGTLEADFRAKGPISRMTPVGTAKLSAQHLAVWELGEWTDVAVDAFIDEDTLRIAQLEAHRGRGWVTAELQANGLRRSGGAELTGKLASRELTLSRAGQDLLTIDVDLSLRGTLAGGDLRADATIPEATVILPTRSPRPLQSLETRSDITIGPARERKKATSAEVPRGDGGPFHALVHLLVPNRFFVKSESPRADVELKADLELEVNRGELAMTGTVSTLGGRAEPIRGRVFVIERGRVQFSGGPPAAAALDVTATYDNPTAKVQVNVSGPVSQPQIRMTSQPPLDESQIALLIATGRTELKANSGGVGTLAGDDASRAALGSVATQLFKDLVAEKLPVDSVAVEPGQLRAGKYISEKIYVGYTRRFTVQPQQQQNQNELRFEYQFTPRWNFELRYGDAGAGGASLVWSRDY